MSGKVEIFLGIDNDSLNKQDEGDHKPILRPKTKWWLASILLPIASIIIGFIIVISDPGSGTDWFRGIRYGVYSILLGSLLSLVSAVISFCLRERKAALSLLLALPSLIVWIYVAYGMARAPYERERRNIAEAEYRKQEREQSLQIDHWTKEFREHPELITSDDFWETHTPPDKAIHYGMLHILNDKSFVVTPEIKTYIITHFPEESRSVLANGRASTAELEAYANDTNCPAAETALEILLRDKSFEFTDHYRQLALKQYPRLKEYVFNFGCFTKDELKQMIHDPHTQGIDKMFAERALKQNSFKQDNP